MLMMMGGVAQSPDGSTATDDEAYDTKKWDSAVMIGEHGNAEGVAVLSQRKRDLKKQETEPQRKQLRGLDQFMYCLRRCAEAAWLNPTGWPTETEYENWEKGLVKMGVTLYLANGVLDYVLEKVKAKQAKNDNMTR